MQTSTLLLVLGTCCLATIATASTVPVLMWGNNDNYAPVNAIKAYTSDEFTNIVKSHQTADTTTIVFTEDTLSAADLSSNRNSYRNLQRAVSKLYLSSVESPQKTIEQLAPTDNVVRLSAAEASVAGSIPAGSRFVFVTLSAPATVDVSRADLLRAHDAEIAAVQSAVAAEATNALFIYTGRQSAPIQLRSARVARQAPSPTPSSANYTFFNQDRLMLYYTNLTFDNAVIEIASMSATFNGTVINVQLTGKVPTDTLSFEVHTDNTTWWQLENIQFRGVQQMPRDQQLGALPEFSYHCTPAIEFNVFATNARTVTVRSKLLWSGLQVEPNFEAAGADLKPRVSFSDSWDCVSFISEGFLGGFLVTLLMLMILTIGVAWIMDIRTMDRFDDAKGKAISVASTE